MGNKFDRMDEVSTQVGSALTDQTSQVQLYRQKVKQDALLMLDPLSGIKKYVPLVSEIDQSSILRRRKKQAKLSKSLSSASVSSHLKKSKKIKKYASSSEGVAEQLANPYIVEELDSPTLLNELMGASDLNRVRRINF